jgi:hypothetical protein
LTLSPFASGLIASRDVNRKAFSLVRVPTEEEECERAFTRQRQQIVRERHRLQAMGRILLGSRGIHVTGKWWTGQTGKLIREETPGQVRPLFLFSGLNRATGAWQREPRRTRG